MSLWAYDHLSLVSIAACNKHDLRHLSLIILLLQSCLVDHRVRKNQILCFHLKGRHILHQKTSLAGYLLVNQDWNFAEVHFWLHSAFLLIFLGPFLFLSLSLELTFSFFSFLSSSSKGSSKTTSSVPFEFGSVCLSTMLSVDN